MEQVNCSNCMVCAFKDNLCTSEICDRFRKRGNCEDFESLLLNSIKHGRWEEKEIDDYPIDQWQSARCSVCGKYLTTPFMYYFSPFNYCPNCGARMEGVE